MKLFDVLFITSLYGVFFAAVSYSTPNGTNGQKTTEGIIRAIVKRDRKSR